MMERLMIVPALIIVMVKLIPISFRFRQQMAKKHMNWAANHS
jgi:hypothetical protein